MKKWLVIIGIALAALHQDFWLWNNSDLLLGLMPVGLGYHALYSVIVALFWGAVIVKAWPTELDLLTDHEHDTPQEPPKGAS